MNTSLQKLANELLHEKLDKLSVDGSIHGIERSCEDGSWVELLDENNEPIYHHMGTTGLDFINRLPWLDDDHIQLGHRKFMLEFITRNASEFSFIEV